MTKWTGRYVLCGIALVLWVITYWEYGVVPEFLTGLVGSAWGALFISRELEKRKQDNGLAAKVLSQAVEHGRR